MPRPRREAVRQEFAEEVKRIARAQLQQHGTGGLSLRAIAREMEVTAPAIYNYFPRLDDLITALIVDAFTALADAMSAAAQAAEPAGVRARLRAALLAYRDYAVTYPADFQLIYGSPIPGYNAPSEITIPLARRPLDLLMALMMDATHGQGVPPQVAFEIPPAIGDYFKLWMGDIPAPLAPTLYWLFIGWSRIHGIVMLEIFDHLPPVVGDTAAMYAQQVDAMIDQILPP